MAKPNLFTFFQEVRSEASKVTWPTRKEVMITTGMVFVPCERGVSHNPAEAASSDDLAAGTRVLAAAAMALLESPSS